MNNIKIFLVGTALATAFLLGGNHASSATHAVPGSFATIQAAVDAASEGDTITVAAGTYAEHVTINKSLTLQGANVGVAGNASRGAESIITGGTTGAIQITANNVTVDGFKIMSASNNLGTGIHMSATHAGAMIKNNVITGNQMGIYANSNGASTISYNLFDGNNETGAAGGSAIYAEFTNALTIDNNEFKNHTTNSSIIFAATAANVHMNTVVTNNNIHGNTNASNIYVVAMNGGTFTGNTVTSASDVTGISFSGGNSNITATKNMITAGMRGIRIEDAGYGFGGNSNIVINRNSINGSTYSVGNISGYTGNVNATCNWWGSADGAGSTTTSNVDYSTWLITNDLDGACTGGTTPSDVTVTIAKYVNGVMATTGNTNTASFPMHAVFPGGEGDYNLTSTGYNNPDAYKATTAMMPSGSNYSTNEITTTSCTAAYPFTLAGYSTGSSMENAAAATQSMTMPSFTNLTSNQFVIVWNKTCAPAPTLLTPANDSTMTSAAATMADWSDVTTPASGSVTYIYESSMSSAINADGSFVTPIYTSGALTESQISTVGTPNGVYYWHVKAIDGAGNSSPWAAPFKITISDTVTPPPTGTSLVDMTWAIAIEMDNTLANNPTNKFDWKALGDTTDYLAYSLDESYWADADHVMNKKVQDYHGKTVKALKQLKQSNKGLVPAATLQGWIDRLIAIDRKIATNQIDQAVAWSGKPAKITKANNWVTTGDNHVTMGETVQAVTDYQNAWKFAWDATSH
jgi:hypothetical protein